MKGGVGGKRGMRKGWRAVRSQRGRQRMRRFPSCLVSARMVKGGWRGEGERVRMSRCRDCLWRPDRVPQFACSQPANGTATGAAVISKATTTTSTSLARSAQSNSAANSRQLPRCANPVHLRCRRETRLVRCLTQSSLPSPPLLLLRPLLARHLFRPATTSSQSILLLVSLLVARVSFWLTVSVRGKLELTGMQWLHARLWACFPNAGPSRPPAWSAATRLEQASHLSSSRGLLRQWSATGARIFAGLGTRYIHVRAQADTDLASRSAPVVLACHTSSCVVASLAGGLVACFASSPRC